MRLLSLITLLLILGVTIPEKLQARWETDTHGIALIVEDEIITFNDLNSRLETAKATAGITEEEITDEIRDTIIQVLIDEKLYLIEAKRLGIKISQKEVDNAMRSLEEKNGLIPGSFNQFMQEQGLDQDQFINQLRAQIAWTKIISAKIRPQITIAEKEIDEELERMISAESLRNKASDQQEIHLSEIILRLKENETKKAFKDRAEDVYWRLKEGEEFAYVAQEYSESSTSKRGGDIGWIDRSALVPAITNALMELEPDEFSRPFLVGDRYTILKYHGQRRKQTLAERKISSTNIILDQVFIPFRTMNKQAITQAKQTLFTARKKIDSCLDTEKARDSIKEALRTRPMKTTINRLHPEVQKVVSSLEVNEASPVVSTNLGLHVFIVCNKMITDTIIGLPKREEVKEKLTGEKIRIQSKGYLRNLRRDAYIEKRI